jgi:hypothetical protein
VPRVLIGVPDKKRFSAVQRVVNALPTPADYMFRVAELGNAPSAMEQILMDW